MMTYQELQNQGKIQFSNMKYAEAAQSFYQAHQLMPADYNSAIFLCRTYFKLGDYKSSASWGDYLISLFPKDAQAHHFAGEAYHELDESEKAIVYLLKSLELASDQSGPLNYLVIAYSYLQSYKQVKHYALKILDIEASSYLANSELSIACYYLDEFQSAIKYGNIALSLDEGSANLFYHIGMSYSCVFDYENAIKYYSMIFNCTNDEVLNAFANSSISYAYQMLGLYQNAISYLQKGLKEGELKYLFYHSLANCYYQTNEYNLALQIIEEGLQELEDDQEQIVELLLIKGDVLNADEQYAKAEEIYKEILSLSPKNANIYSALGDLYYNHFQDITKAIEHYNMAIDINEDLIDSHNALGYLYRLEGATNQAKYAFNKALMIEEDNETTLAGLGDCALNENAFEDAITFYQKVLKIKPNSAVAYWGIGEASNRLGYKTDAEKNLLKALDLSPDWTIANYSLGELYLQRALEYEDVTHFLAFTNIGKARKYFKHGLSNEEDFALIHLSISKMPVGSLPKDEYKPLEHFLRAIFLMEKNRYNFLTMSSRKFDLISQALSYDLPLLVFGILGNSQEDAEDQHYLNPQIEQANLLTADFRTLFYLWDDNKFIENVVLKCVLMFYSGDIVNAYKLLKKCLDNSRINLIAHYYYLLSSALLMEKHDRSLRIAVSIVNETFKGKINFKDAYYGAMILDLAGENSRAKGILDQLGGKGFLPAALLSANKKYDTFLELLKDSSFKFKELLAGATGEFYRKPSILIMDLEAEAPMSAINPLINYMECNVLFPDSSSTFFIKHIQISQFQGQKKETYIKQHYPEKHKLIYGSIDDQLWIERKINEIQSNSWASSEVLLTYLADELLKNATLQLHDLKTMVKDLHAVNYRSYVILANRLNEFGKISDKDKSILQYYTIYCAGAVDAFTPPNIVKKSIMGEGMDTLELFASLFIKVPLAKCIAIKDLIAGLYFKRFGKNREILDLKSFITDHWEYDARINESA